MKKIIVLVSLLISTALSAQMPPQDLLNPAAPIEPPQAVYTPPPPQKPPIVRDSGVTDEVARLRRELNEMQSYVYKNPESRGSVTTSSVPTDPLAVAGVGKFDEDFRDLRGKIEELQFKNQKLEERLNKLSEDFEFRFRKLEGGDSHAETSETPASAPIVTNGITGPVPGTMAAGSAGAPRQLGTTKPTSSAPAPEQPSGNSAKDLYDDAYDLFKTGKKSESLGAFENFLSKHPKDKLAGNAHFYIGEVYYSQKDYAAAAKKYVDSYKKFAKGEKAPESLYKLSKSLENLQKKKEACTSLAELYEKFPKMPDNVKKKADEQNKKLSCKI